VAEGSILFPAGRPIPRRKWPSEGGRGRGRVGGVVCIGGVVRVSV
jgi:hypothetical protein